MTLPRADNALMADSAFGPRELFPTVHATKLDEGSDSSGFVKTVFGAVSPPPILVGFIGSSWPQTTWFDVERLPTMFTYPFCYFEVALP